MRHFENLPFEKFKIIFDSEQHENTKPTPLNLFHLISNQYYKENFHSDILKSLLCPKTNKVDGRKLMGLFIDCLKKKACDIDKDEFLKEYEVEREKNRIDILIKSKAYKTAILIENKINNAPDQDNQIPRYYKRLTDDKDIQKIYTVYLPLVGYRYPDKSTWRAIDGMADEKWKELKEELEKSFIHLPVFSLESHEYSLINQWINIALSSNRVESADTLFILRQYKEILEIMANQELDLAKSEELLKLVDANKISLNTVNNLIIAYNNIPKFIATNTKEFKVFDKFYGKPKVFDSTKKGGDTEWAYKFESPNEAYKNIPKVLRLSFRRDKYKIHLWLNNEGQGDEKDLDQIKKFLGQDIENSDRAILEFKRSPESFKEYVEEFNPDELERMKTLIKDKLIPRFEEMK